MDFINQVDLVATTSRHVLGVFQQVPSIVYTSTRGGIYLNEINKPVLFHFQTN